MTWMFLFSVSRVGEAPRAHHRILDKSEKEKCLLPRISEERYMFSMEHPPDTIESEVISLNETELIRLCNIIMYK